MVEGGNVDIPLGECCCFRSEIMLTSHRSISSRAMKKEISRSLPRAGMPVYNLHWFYGTSKIHRYTSFTVRAGSGVSTNFAC